MNVYPSAIRDVLLSRFSGAVTPYMRTLKQREDQVRFDSPIAFEIERRPELGASQLAVVRAAIETEVRSRLQIRVDVTIVEPGTIPRTAYKTALVQLGDSSAVVGREVAWHTFLRRRSIASSRADSARSATGSAADQSLLEYQITFENAIVGICSMRNRILLRCNRRMEQIFGFGPGELDQQPVRILYPNKEAYERIDKVYANFPRHNQYVHEPQLVRKDGRLIWCIVSGRLLDSREPAEGSIWVVQDITERRITENALRQANKRLEMRVEQRTTNLRRTNQALKVEVQRRKDMHVALVESREKYRALFRTFPIGVAITDDQGNIVEVNRALQRLTGRRDIAGIQRIGSQAGDLIKPDGGEVSRENLARVRALREHRRIEDEEVGLLLPDGSRLWFNTIAAPIPVRGYGVVATYSDVTERKQAVEREKRQQAEFSRAARLNVMGEMASALAHELGQPLSSCLNYLEGLILRLEVGTAETADIATALASARRQAERAGEIVNRVRNYVRRHRPERRIVDVNEIIRDVVSFLSFEARSQGSVVRLALAPQRLAAFVDRVEIEQVVLNLLKNALDAVCAVPKRRRIVSISTRSRCKGLIECLVSDHGCGLPADGVVRVFEPYVTTKPDGLGLGLSICRTIIDSHDGKLKAAHNRPHGAKFSFTLPIGEVRP